MLSQRLIYATGVTGATTRGAIATVATATAATTVASLPATAWGLDPTGAQIADFVFLFFLGSTLPAGGVDGKQVTINNVASVAKV